jgi:hypothetical protein
MVTEHQRSPLPGKRPSTRSAVAWGAAALAGSAALGLLGGLIWELIAPRATLQEIAAGTAELVNAETRAFITADVWFCVVAVVAGLLTGVVGYRFAVSARTGGARALVVSCLILGGLAGALVMLWLGERLGQSGYNQHLASSANGTLFPDTLALGAKSALAFWPMFTAIVLLVAEWGTRTPAPAGQSGQEGHERHGGGEGHGGQTEQVTPPGPGLTP